jgi:Rab GDP dissociation inhibitor
MSPLMGFFEKRRVKKFLEFIQSYVEGDAATHLDIDLDKMTMGQVYVRQPARATYERLML